MPIHCGDFVEAWDATKPESFDVTESDGHAIGRVLSVDRASNRITVILPSEQTATCWLDSAVVIQP